MIVKQMMFKRLTLCATAIKFNLKLCINSDLKIYRKFIKS